MHRFLKSKTFQTPLAELESKTPVEGAETWLPPLKISHSVTQGGNQEKALIVTSSLQTHAAHQLWLCVLPPFSLAHSECFPPNHNNSESAKTYQSLAKLRLQRGQPAGFYGLVQQQLILHSATNPI